MIERTYSRHIGDHADALARVALLDTNVVPASNVEPLTRISHIDRISEGQRRRLRATVAAVESCNLGKSWFA